MSSSGEKAAAALATKTGIVLCKVMRVWQVNLIRDEEVPDRPEVE